MQTKMREYRLKNGIAADEIAELIGVTVQTYYKKETGVLKFSLLEAKKIAERCGDSIERIFFDTEIPKTDNENL